MSPYANKKPRYVREWYLKLKSRFKKIREEKEKAEKLKMSLNEAIQA